MTASISIFPFLVGCTLDFAEQFALLNDKQSIILTAQQEISLSELVGYSLPQRTI